MGANLGVPIVSPAIVRGELGCHRLVLQHMPAEVAEHATQVWSVRVCAHEPGVLPVRIHDVVPHCLNQSANAFGHHRTVLVAGDAELFESAHARANGRWR